MKIKRKRNRGNRNVVNLSISVRKVLLECFLHGLEWLRLLKMLLKSTKYREMTSSFPGKPWRKKHEYLAALRTFLIFSSLHVWMRFTANSLCSNVSHIKEGVESYQGGSRVRHFSTDTFSVISYSPFQLSFLENCNVSTPLFEASPEQMG